MLRSVATCLRTCSTSWAVTPFLTLRSQVVATAMSPSPSTQRSHMRLASEPAPDSSLPRVLMVPQPVNQIELASTTHFIHVKDLRIVFLLNSCSDGNPVGHTMCLAGLTSIIHALRKIRYWQIPYTLWGKVSVRTVTMRF